MKNTFINNIAYSLRQVECFLNNVSRVKKARKTTKTLLLLSDCFKSMSKKRR